jgi:hypothetical protein
MGLNGAGTVVKIHKIQIKIGLFLLAYYAAWGLLAGVPAYFLVRFLLAN